MDPEIVYHLGPVLGILGIGSMILIAIKMRYTHLRHTRAGQVGQDELERREDVASLHDEVRALREQLVDVSERLEFTERVLIQGKARDEDSDALPRPERP